MATKATPEAEKPPRVRVTLKRGKGDPIIAESYESLSTGVLRCVVKDKDAPGGTRTVDVPQIDVQALEPAQK